MLKREQSIVKRKFNQFVTYNKPLLEQLYQHPRIRERVTFPAFCSFAFDYTS